MRVDLGISDDAPVPQVGAPGSPEDENAEESSMESDAGVPMEEVPYAASNVAIFPGGQDPVSNMDQMLQVSESLMQTGGQTALEHGFDTVCPGGAVKKRRRVDEEPAPVAESEQNEEDEMPHNEGVSAKKLKQVGIGAFFSSPSKPPAPSPVSSYSFSIAPSPQSASTEPADEPEAQVAQPHVVERAGSKRTMRIKHLEPTFHKRSECAKVANEETVKAVAPMVDTIIEAFPEAEGMRHLLVTEHEVKVTKKDYGKLDIAVIIDPKKEGKREDFIVVVIE
jgi:hypothetical protein